MFCLSGRHTMKRLSGKGRFGKMLALAEAAWLKNIGGSVDQAKSRRSRQCVRRFRDRIYVQSACVGKAPAPPHSCHVLGEFSTWVQQAWSWEDSTVRYGLRMTAKGGEPCQI